MADQDKTIKNTYSLTTFLPVFMGLVSKASDPAAKDAKAKKANFVSLILVILKYLPVVAKGKRENKDVTM